MSSFSLKSRDNDIKKKKKNNNFNIFKKSLWYKKQQTLRSFKKYINNNWKKQKQQYFFLWGIMMTGGKGQFRITENQNFDEGCLENLMAMEAPQKVLKA